MRLVIVLSIMLCSFSYGFQSYARVRPNAFTSLHMADTDRDKGYGPVGSLLRQGPVPFFIRITKPDTYNAAVEKYMALEKCDRMTAQGNMDAYFQDPNGWAADKLRSRKTGIEIDYSKANMSQGSLILTGIWSAGLLLLVTRIILVQVFHQT